MIDPGKIHVVGCVAVDDCRQQQRVAGPGLYGALGECARYQRVGVDGKVISVILERRHRDHAHRILLHPLGDLGQVSSA